MVYKPTIPASTDKPAQSQADIQENFTQLNNQFKIEHIAFDAAADNGQHKFITLKRSAGVVPAGTDWVVAQALTPAANPYLQLVNASTFFSIPLTYYFTKHIIAGTATRNLIDFGPAGINLFPQSGTISLYDKNTQNRTVFAPYTWVGGVLYIPGVNGQLVAGTTFTRFDTAGSVLQLEVNALAVATDVSVKISGTAI